MRSARFMAALVGILVFFASAAFAQSYPSKPLRMLVPFPPGGAPDLVARLLATNLSARFGQPVVVENRPGAAGNIASEAAAKSAPDGYTLYLAAHPPFTLNPMLYSRVPYDPVKDFAPIALAGSQWFVLVVNPGLPVRTPQELVAYAKANPGKLSYSSYGSGTPHHLGMEFLKVALGLDIVHVPYDKAISQVVPDLVSGVVPVALSAVAVAGPHLKSGKLLPLAVTSRQRVPALPDVPTVAETLVPDYEVTAWFGLVAPAGTPREIITKLNAETVHAFAVPETVTRLNGLGLEPRTSSPEGLAAIIQAEIAKWGRIVKEAKLRVD
jgi:tripartite-type tricarboxylate transporter receptor subunit TctC